MTRGPTALARISIERPPASLRRRRRLIRDIRGICQHRGPRRTVAGPGCCVAA